MVQEKPSEVLNVQELAKWCITRQEIATLIASSGLADPTHLAQLDCSTNQAVPR